MAIAVQASPAPIVGFWDGSDRRRPQTGKNGRFVASAEKTAAQEAPGAAIDEVPATSVSRFFPAGDTRAPPLVGS
ncbi:MAG: hypothetical protein WD647_03010 [Steroidobacteraceae bacterium]